MTTSFQAVVVMSMSKIYRSKEKTILLVSNLNIIREALQQSHRILSLSMMKSIPRMSLGYIQFIILRFYLKISKNIKRLKSSKLR